MITTEEVQQESEHYPIVAQELSSKIVDTESYKEAAAYLVAIKGFRKKVEEAFGPVVVKARAAWQAALDLRKRADSPLDEAEGILKDALGRYEAEQTRKRRAEEDRLLAEQRKAQEEARLNAAIAAEQNGNHDQAEAIFAAPPAPMAPVVIPNEAKVDNLSFRESWKFRIVNAALIPREYMVPDEKKLGQIARALKGETRIPGIEVYPQREVAVRAR